MLNVDVSVKYQMIVVLVIQKTMWTAIVGILYSYMVLVKGEVSKQMPIYLSKRAFLPYLPLGLTSTVTYGVTSDYCTDSTFGQRPNRAQERPDNLTDGANPK